MERTRIGLYAVTACFPIQVEFSSRTAVQLERLCLHPALSPARKRHPALLDEHLAVARILLAAAAAGVVRQLGRQHFPRTCTPYRIKKLTASPPPTLQLVGVGPSLVFRKQNSVLGSLEDGSVEESEAAAAGAGRAQQTECGARVLRHRATATPLRPRPALSLYPPLYTQHSKVHKIHL